MGRRLLENCTQRSSGDGLEERERGPGQSPSLQGAPGQAGGGRFFLWSLQNEKKKIIRTFKKHILIQCPFCPGIFEC